jgi:Transposase DDE domain
MSHATQGRVGHQVESLRRQFLQAPGLPFGDVLDAQQVERALEEENVQSCDCVYTALVTLRMLLSQVMDADPSLRQAVSRLLAERAAAGQPKISANTGAYSQARRRLSEALLQRLTRRVGDELLLQAPVRWLWHGRDVKIVDGSTVSMPDTPENQAAYPQPRSQKPGLGFPLARVLVVFSLAVGSALDAAMGRYQGKETGETALFRSLHDNLCQGDIVLADRYFCSYFEIALLQQRGVDVVLRLHQRRTADFRRGQRLGHNDHVVVWHKPPRPPWMDKATYRQLPDTLTLREMRFQVTAPGFRTDTIVVVSTLVDAEEVSIQDLAELYRARWQAELDLRSLKTTMQMDILRAKSPAMVRKEFWAHLLCYNLIRTIMAQAAQQHNLLPREISFKGTVQTLVAFAPYALLARPGPLDEFSNRVLAAIAQHRVGDRPDRCEPRARKRRNDTYPLLMMPRRQAQALLRKGSYG